MENPLDVLSRAASMVETNDYIARDNGHKRISDHDSPRKQLPTKVLKYDRIRERQDVPPPPLIYDHDRFTKKCTGTQTSYTSFPNELYHPPAGINLIHHNGAPHYACLAPMNPSLHAYHVPVNNEQQLHRPLNLSSGHPSASLASPTLRSPVITHTPPHSYHHSDTPREYATPTKVLSVPADLHDPIEEHFRRSLGRDYPECMSNKSSRSSSPASPDSPFMTQFTYVNALTSLQNSIQNEPSMTCNTNTVDGLAPTLTNLDVATSQNVTISATESVDDHFSKSLGDQMWSNLKVKGSVDEHFHKALGDTWLRIKAEKETTQSDVVSNSNHHPAHQPLPPSCPPHHISALSS